MAFFQNLISKKEWALGLIKPLTSPVIKVYCPYPLCTKELSPAPERSKKCPYCKEHIVTRVHYYTKEKTFLTVAQAEVFDIDRANYKHFKHFRESLRQFLDVDDTWLLLIYHEHTAILRKRHNKEPTLENVVGSISNYLVTMYPSIAATVHFQHAIFMHETGKECQHIRKESFRLELQEYKKSGHQKVQIITHEKKSCTHCITLDKKVLTIDQAVETQLLPCKDCTFVFNEKDPVGWCRCSYSTVN
jgi:hypothetical protein